MAVTADPSANPPSSDALIERLVQSTLGVWDIFTVYLGDQLGLYDALVNEGSATSVRLADVTGLAERYVREWLEQQAVSGIVDVERDDADPLKRRYSLPLEHAEVLTGRDSLNYLAPLARIVVGVVGPVPAVKEAFRTGGGVSFADYGSDLRLGQAGMNRNLFLQQLGTEYFPAIPGLHARLRADPPARIADIGCGVGWSSIGMALAYPGVKVDGYDMDETSVEEAQRNIAESGVADRVTVSLRDAGDPSLAGQYDLVTAFECIHDMPDPVSVLRAMHRLRRKDGTVVIMDERVGETFSPAAATDIERMLYGFSVFHCLPAGLADQPSVGTGTIMRPSMLRGYAQEAGFRDVEILPLENDFFTFYRLVA